MSWLKENKILSLLLLAVTWLTCNVESLWQKRNPPQADISPGYFSTLDFSNDIGVERLQSTFGEILVGSKGAAKKGEGYTVKLSIINTTSIVLNGPVVNLSWGSEGKSVTVPNTNVSIYPGKQKVISYFLTPLVEDELKSVRTTVRFDTMSSYQ